MATKDEVIEVLKGVNDPEIMIDVWTLGLIYDIKISGDTVHILMTLTTPMCPYGPMLLEMVEESIRSIKGVSKVELELTFEPMWQPSAELREMMGL
jgi:metal-sulfur cluster biosynthetic enzyme